MQLHALVVFILHVRWRKPVTSQNAAYTRIIQATAAAVAGPTVVEMGEIDIFPAIIYQHLKYRDTGVRYDDHFVTISASIYI